MPLLCIASPEGGVGKTTVAAIIVFTPLAAEEQGAFALGGLLVAFLIGRFRGRAAMLALAALSSMASVRYIVWRLSDTLDHSGPLQTLLGIGLLLAGLYAVIVLILAYAQTAWPLDRKPVPLPAMAAAEADAATPLLFVDATHPAYDAHPATGWIRRGQTAPLKSNHGRANVTLNGALSWPAREAITREAPLITGAEMVAFFEQIAERYPAARSITLVLDNATYNRARCVRDWLARPGCRVRLIYLPPYAPNLNLIERL